jgi:hypothetical protein
MKHMKHMNSIYHALRESVELEEVSPYYFSTSQMVADLLIKPLDRANIVAGCTTFCVCVWLKMSLIRGVCHRYSESCSLRTLWGVKICANQ